MTYHRLRLYRTNLNRNVRYSTVWVQIQYVYEALKYISEAKNNPEGEKIADSIDMDISNEMDEVPDDDQIVPDRSISLDENVNNVALISKAGFHIDAPFW